MQPVHYNRIAYYGLFLKLVINDPPGPVHQNDPSVWADLNPVGIWRGLRCRLFDETGAMTGYAFTTNPAWQIVDVLLRRRLFPEYALDPYSGPDDLPASVRARFDWGAIAAAATAYDVIMPNGNRQFEGNYAFAQQTTLQAVLTQMLTGCRSFIKERSGQIGLYLDQARSSVFTFSRKNADSFTANDASLHSAANRYVAKFRDTLIPSAADIVSITNPDHQSPTVTMLNPHPFAAADRVVIGGTGTKYDGNWVVASVPTGDSITSLTLTPKGSNYPASLGAGGKMGLLYSRFKDRAPEFNHRRAQYAKGAIGRGIARQRNKVKLETDFLNCTYDQASRVSQYMMTRALGSDVIPYVTPVAAEVSLPLFAADAAGSGNLAIGLEPGDRVTVDDTLSVTYAGDYEVLTANPQLASSTPGGDGTLQRSPVAGMQQLTLGPYNSDAFVAASDPDAAGWDIVPGSQAGNSTQYTQIDLADGFAAFFTGSIADGQAISIPSVGFNAANVMTWVSPQGYIEADGQLHNIVNCDVDAGTRMAHLVYGGPSGATWHGDLNYACLAWRSLNSARVFSQGGYSFVELTLAGGELVCFGTGLAAASTAVVVPDGYSLAQSILLAMPRTGPDSGHNAHGFRAMVTNDGVAHHDYQDGEGNQWQGDTRPLMFFWKNNMGTVSTLPPSTSGTLTPPQWYLFPLSTGKTLIVGGFTVQDARFTGSLDVPSRSNLPSIPGMIALPSRYGGTTLQTMTCADGFQIVDHPAHGQKECFVDATLNVLTSFEDGEGNVWSAPFLQAQVRF